MMNKRIDLIDSDPKVTVLDNGFMKVDAYLTRVGVFNYRGDDGSIVRELRHPDEVFTDKSLSSLELSTLTLNHPPQFVDPKNFSEFSVGSVSSVGVDKTFVSGRVLIARSDALSAVSKGIKQISCGYTCDVVHKSGTFNGEEYDAVQENIVYNHVAVVIKGRAGNDVRLHMDSSNVNIRVGEKMKVDKTENLDSDLLSIAEAKRDAALGECSKQVGIIKGLKAEVIAAKSQNLELTKKVDSLQKLELEFNSRVTERVALESVAAKILKSDTDLRKMDSKDIKKSVIGLVYPNISLEDRTDAAISALFEASCESVSQEDKEEKPEKKADSIDVTGLISKKLDGSNNEKEFDFREAQLEQIRRGVK